MVTNDKTSGNAAKWFRILAFLTLVLFTFFLNKALAQTTQPLPSSSFTRSDFFKATGPKIAEMLLIPQIDHALFDQEKDGYLSYSKTFPGGSESSLFLKQENFGNEFKRIIRIREAPDKSGGGYEKIIREKKAYRPSQQGRKIKARFLDIVARPAQGDITRDILIYKHDTLSGKLERFTWASYIQIAGQPALARIKSFSYFLWNETGILLRASARRWSEPGIEDGLYPIY